MALVLAPVLFLGISMHAHVMPSSIQFWFVKVSVGITARLPGLEEQGWLSRVTLYDCSIEGWSGNRRRYSRSFHWMQEDQGRKCGC